MALSDASQNTWSSVDLAVLYVVGAMHLGTDVDFMSGSCPSHFLKARTLSGSRSSSQSFPNVHSCQYNNRATNTNGATKPSASYTDKYMEHKPRLVITADFLYRLTEKLSVSDIHDTPKRVHQAICRAVDLGVGRLQHGVLA